MYKQVAISMKILNTYKPSIQMRYIYLLLTGFLIFLNYIAQNVLYHNQINEVYSAESDSISIPIYVILTTTVIIFILEILGILLASQKWFSWMGIGLTCISFMLAVGSCLEWLSPNHLLIAASHLPIIFICGYISIRSLYILKESSK
jgi:hypothetical protein